MPRRTISLGYQPAHFRFVDDHGPLANGLGYAVGQFMDAGRSRAQIEMEREKQAKDEVYRTGRDQVGDARADRALDLQELALGLKRTSAAAKPASPVPSHVADNIDGVVQQKNLGEGLLEAVMDNLGQPTGKYQPRIGAPPEDLAAIERNRMGTYLDAGVDPMSLTPTPAGRWQPPSPEVADELAAHQAENERMRAELGVKPAVAGELNAGDVLGAAPTAPAPADKRGFFGRAGAGFDEVTGLDWFGEDETPSLEQGYQAAGFPPEIAAGLAQNGTTAEAVQQWATVLGGAQGPEAMESAAQELLLLKANNPADYAALAQALRWMDSQGSR